MELKSKYKNWWQNNKPLLWLLLISLVMLCFVVIIMFCQLIGINWVTGWFFGWIGLILGIYLSILAVKLLIKTENHFLFYFFFLLRLGVYATPLFIAFFNENHFVHFGGVLLGLSPLIFTPFINGQIFKRYSLIS